MKIDISAITGVVNKINEVVSGERVVPGIILNICDNELSVYCTVSKKSFVERVECETEEGDVKGKVFITYEQFERAISNCQPSGAIVVREISINFVSSNMLKVSAVQELLVESDGVSEYRSMAKKEMDINYMLVDGSKDQRVVLLNRTNYEAMFESETAPDTWDRTELMNMFNSMSFEKGKVVYMSPKTQKAFVVNTAFTCAVPISSNEEAIDAVFGAMPTPVANDDNSGNVEDVSDTSRRLTYQIIITAANAKCIASVLSKMKDDTVKMFKKSDFLFVYNENETVAISFDTAKGSSVHTNNFNTFSSLPYSKYQITFVREFLADSIKSALNSSKSEKIELTFKKSETNISGYCMVINSSNSGSNINDTYSVELDSVVDTNGTLEGDKITMSLKIFSDMLSQLKSTMVAFDIAEIQSGQMCLRLAELNDDKVYREWKIARHNLGIGEDEPTPVEVKIGYRDKTLDTCQYCMISR